jgi:PAS domain S-box-containing protein
MPTQEHEVDLEDTRLLMRQDELAQSKLRYADLFDFAPISYCTLDENGVIEEANLAVARLLGGTSQQFIRQPFDEFLVPDDRERFHEYLRHCRETSQRLRIELRLLPKDSEPVVVELYTIATREMEHGRLQSRCVIVNLTERRRAEEALQRSQVELALRAKHHFLSESSAAFSASLHYETVLENIVRMSIPQLADCAAVDIVQPDGSLLRAAVAHIDKAKESRVWELGKMPEDNNEAFGKAKVVRSGRSEMYAEMSESLVASVAGSAAHLEVLRQINCRSFICVPLMVRGKAIGAIDFMRIDGEQRYSLSDLTLAEEFTDRAAMAIDNAMLYSKEQAVNDFKDRFMAMVSHELKTPLTPILGAIYRLRLIRANDHDVQNMADIVERSARKQTAIIDDLLDVSRVMTGKFQLNKRLIDLSAVIRGVADAAQANADAAQVQLDATIVPTRPISCDAERVQQAISMLVANGIKFSSAGGTVRLRMEDEPSLVRITVADDGEGLAAEFLPHIFEPFRQADQFSTRSYGGLGLGLSLARHIVTQHGGTIRAESEGKGKGATFTVELPY